MIGSVVGFLIAIVVILGFGFSGLPQSTLPYLILFTASGSAFLLAVVLVHAFFFNPLQRYEQKMVPKTIELFQKNYLLRGMSLYLFTFPLFSYGLALAISWEEPASTNRYYLAMWVVLAGLALDIFRAYLKQCFNFLNPFEGIRRSYNQAEGYAEKGEEGDMCGWVDVLAETGLKAIQRASTTLCSNAVMMIPLVLEKYSSTCIKRELSLSGVASSRDKFNYTLFYVCDRLDMLYTHALPLPYESVCETIVTALGKIALAAARYDCLFASYPIRLIGQFSDRAFEKGYEELGVKADCLLIEIARAFIEEVKGLRTGLKEPFATLIAHLERSSKDAFKKDKTMNISLLIKPFQDIKDLLKSPQVQDHPDLSFIEKEVDRIIGEFSALNQVMARIPPQKS